MNFQVTLKKVMNLRFWWQPVKDLTLNSSILWKKSRQHSQTVITILVQLWQSKKSASRLLRKVTLMSWSGENTKEKSPSLFWFISQKDQLLYSKSQMIHWTKISLVMVDPLIISQNLFLTISILKLVEELVDSLQRYSLKNQSSKQELLWHFTISVILYSSVITDINSKKLDRKLISKK